MSVGSILGGIAGPLTLGGAAYAPSKMEREYRNQLLGERTGERKKILGLKIGAREREGGDIARIRQMQREAPSLTPSARAQAVTQQGLAQLARGSASGAGASGMQQQQAGQVMKAGQQVAAQEASARRAQDLAAAEALRQSVLSNMLQARNMEMQRRGMAMQYLQSIQPGLGKELGGQMREQATQQFQGAAGAGY